MYKLLISILTFAFTSLVTVMSAPTTCNNPLLSTFGFTPLSTPQKVANLVYCKSLINSQSCCSDTVINQFQVQANELTGRLTRIVIARDQFLMTMRMKVVNQLQTSLDRLRSASDKAMRVIKASSHLLVRIQQIPQIPLMAIITLQIPQSLPTQLIRLTLQIIQQTPLSLPTQRIQLIPQILQVEVEVRDSLQQMAPTVLAEQQMVPIVLLEQTALKMEQTLLQIQQSQQMERTQQILHQEEQTPQIIQQSQQMEQTPTTRQQIPRNLQTPQEEMGNLTK